MLFALSSTGCERNRFLGPRGAIGPDFAKVEVVDSLVHHANAANLGIDRNVYLLGHTSHLGVAVHGKAVPVIKEDLEVANTLQAVSIRPVDDLEVVDEVRGTKVHLNPRVLLFLGVTEGPGVSISHSRGRVLFAVIAAHDGRLAVGMVHHLLTLLTLLTRLAVALLGLSTLLRVARLAVALLGLTALLRVARLAVALLGLSALLRVARLAVALLGLSTLLGLSALLRVAWLAVTLLGLSTLLRVAWLAVALLRLLVTLLGESLLAAILAPVVVVAVMMAKDLDSRQMQKVLVAFKLDPNDASHGVDANGKSLRHAGKLGVVEVAKNPAIDKDAKVAQALKACSITAINDADLQDLVLLEEVDLSPGVHLALGVAEGLRVAVNQGNSGPLGIVVVAANSGNLSSGNVHHLSRSGDSVFCIRGEEWGKLFGQRFGKERTEIFILVSILNFILVSISFWSKVQVRLNFL